MTKIILVVTGWLIRKTGLLLLLVLALLLTPSIKDAWQSLMDFLPESAISNAAIQPVLKNSIKKKSAQELKVWSLSLQNLLVQKRAELDMLNHEKDSCFLPTCTLAKNSLIYSKEAEIDAILQALNYSDAMSRGSQTCSDLKDVRQSIFKIRPRIQELETHKLRTLAHDLGEYFFSIDSLKQNESKRWTLESLCMLNRTAAVKFQVDQSVIKRNLNTKHAEFLSELEKFKSKKQIFLGQVFAVLPTALWLLLGLILIPIAFKSLAYYAIAPLATRIFGIHLMPSASGELTVLNSTNYLQKINIQNDEEILLDPAALRSTSINAHKITKYVLDGSMPLTSIACGMYLLTMIKFDNEGIVEVAYGDVSFGDSLKIAVLEIPKNSSLVLKPRFLVGTIQKTDHPIKITRHWQLGKLASWLTFQFRYMVLHGPSKIIVKGKNGIAIKYTDVETNLKQSATMGFSANLKYSVRRHDPFYPFFSGANGLFTDRFVGRGFYLQEVGHGKSSNTPFRLLSNPIELLWDAFTKAMGV